MNNEDKQTGYVYVRDNYTIEQKMRVILSKLIHNYIQNLDPDGQPKAKVLDLTALWLEAKHLVNESILEEAKEKKG